tara:strand:+ start:755 stop:1204 length:450 start_codon:yes stop_codon:yes gene_type:complete
MTEQEQSLETQLIDYIKKEPVSFEQKTDDNGFEMSTSQITSSFSKPIITMAIGSASSGLIAGAVSSIIPANMTFFAGLPTIVAGLLGKMVIKNNMARNFFDGVLIAGISQTVSRFIPSSFGQELSAKVQEEFKQEKPCQEQMRGDGIQW